jgi:site-specific DNA recombinase
VRLIAARRLSRWADSSTSIETQTAGIDQYVQAYGHEVVLWTEDLDVSGGVPIKERPDIGPLLAEERLGEWDGIIGYKLDRLFRSQSDYVQFYDEFCRPCKDKGCGEPGCVKHGKVIISAGEHIDTSTDHGKFIADLLVSFAEMERGRMRVRRQEAARRLREAGRWGGGQVPFGYRPVKLPDGGMILEPDPELSKIVWRIAGVIIEGASLSAVARWLEEHEIPTPREASRKTGEDPYRWWPATVRDVLRSRSLLGEMTHQGSTVRGPDGKPVKFEPILDAVTWERLQRALDVASSPQRGERSNGSYLLQIAFCGRCGEPLWQTTAGNGRNYYRCASRARHRPCGESIIRMDLLDWVADDAIVSKIGHRQVMQKVIKPGDDHSQQIAEIGQTITDLVQERFVRGHVRDDYDVVLAQLQAEHARLKALPAGKATVDYVPLGVTVAGHWETLDQQARRAFLREHDIKIFAEHDEDDGTLPEPEPDASVSLYVGHGLRAVVRLGDVRGLRLIASNKVATPGCC